MNLKKVSKPIEPKEEISISEYKQLSQEESKNFIAIYKTKQIRKRSECDSCGHFQGYYQGSRNIGKPISYRKKSMWEIMNDLMVRDMVDSFLSTKPLFEGKAVKFPIKYKK